MLDGDSVKSFLACIVVYKTQRPAFILIGENIQPFFFHGISLTFLK